MILFEYKYTSSSNILNNIQLVTEYSLFEYSILIIMIFMLITTIYYIVPSINFYFVFREKEKAKENRKQMIKQIAMQKDINNIIEKELDI